MEYNRRNPYKNYSDKPKVERISQARLTELIAYDAATGGFTWKIGQRCRKAGAPAGCTDSLGYHRIRVDGRTYPAAHLAWLYTYGVWPAKWMDHRDGNPSNNRLLNLREAVPAENSQNIRLSKRNGSGYLGVSRFGKKWRAQISASGVIRYLGAFDTPLEAHRAYLEAKKLLHPFQPTPRRK